MVRPEDSVVLVVDDDALIRTVMKQVLERRGYSVFVFGSAADFMAFTRPDKPQCILLDSQMPGMSGLEVQDALSRMGDKTPILFLTGYADVSLTRRALTRGAIDLLQKPVDTEELLLRVEGALERHQSIREADRTLADWRRRFEALSAREREVLGQMSLGHPNKIIADNLKISIKTVEIHRSRVMLKMEADSLATLVREYFAALPEADRA